MRDLNRFAFGVKKLGVGQMTNSYPNLSYLDYFIPHGLTHIQDGYDPVFMLTAKVCWGMIKSLCILLREF